MVIQLLNLNENWGTMPGEMQDNELLNWKCSLKNMASCFTEANSSWSHPVWQLMSFSSGCLQRPPVIKVRSIMSVMCYVFVLLYETSLLFVTPSHMSHISVGFKNRGPTPATLVTKSHYCFGHSARRMC